MKKFTKRDFGFSVATGLIAGVVLWQVLEYLKVPEFRNIPWVSLVVIIPVIWILGVFLGFFLGTWFKFFNQFGKFAVIGFTNFAVSLGVLNFLLALTGYSKGYGYAVINSVAFIVATVASYFWNKYWAFNAGDTGGGGAEFGKFFIVTIIAFLVNLAVATAVVNLMHPIFGLNANQWANIGTILGSAAGVVFSFVGFKFAVFHR